MILRFEEFPVFLLFTFFFLFSFFFFHFLFLWSSLLFWVPFLSRTLPPINFDQSMISPNKKRVKSERKSVFTTKVPQTIEKKKAKVEKFNKNKIH